MSLLFSFQGEEGPRGPPGEPGDKGDKVGDSCSGFPESFFFFFFVKAVVCVKKKRRSYFRAWMEAAILMCAVALLRLISLSSAGQPRYPRPTGCSWQKGRECEWTHFCFFRPQLWRCLARCAKWSPLTHLPAFSGSAGYWWERWHTWHSWNQGKCVPAVIMMSNFNRRWKKQKH